MSRSRATALVCAALAACGPAAPSHEPWFVEDSARARLDFVHVAYATQRHWFPEIMCGGVALFDFDGDGWLDVYFAQGGDLGSDPSAQPLDRLFRNRRDGTFEDVTERSGLGERGYGMGCACGDYDADGDVDLYVTNVGANTLYENRGDGTFRDVTAEAGVADIGWSASAAWLDYDRDGLLDLFVAHYLHWSKDKVCFSGDSRRDYCHPNAYGAPELDSLFHNLGGGRFEDVSVSSGIRASDGNGLGLACADFDENGWPDVYVANDMDPGQLWLNQGDGRFVDEAMRRGCALAGGGFAEAGMGVQAFDLEPDGDLDLFRTHLRHQKNTLYSGTRGAKGDVGHFDDTSSEHGVALPSLPFTGFGEVLADFDQDGRLDLYVANGRVSLEEPIPEPDDPYAEANLLMSWNGARFVEVEPAGGTAPSEILCSRALAAGDLDNDGDMDLVIVNRNARASLLRNRAGRPGAWVMFDVRDERGQLALGAMVEIEAGGREQRRLVDPAYSYCASNDPRVHFGLGDAQRVDAVRVKFVDGVIQDFGACGKAKLHVLRRKADK